MPVSCRSLGSEGAISPLPPSEFLQFFNVGLGRSALLDLRQKGSEFRGDHQRAPTKAGQRYSPTVDIGGPVAPDDNNATIGSREPLSIDLCPPGSPVRRMDQNRFASPHVEPDTRHATTGKAARSHATLVDHADLKVTIFGRKLDRQPAASRIIVKHARDIELNACVRFDLEQRNDAPGLDPETEIGRRHLRLDRRWQHPSKILWSGPAAKSRRFHREQALPTTGCWPRPNGLRTAFSPLCGCLVYSMKPRKIAGNIALAQVRSCDCTLRKSMLRRRGSRVERGMRALGRIIVSTRRLCTENNTEILHVDTQAS